MEKSIEPLYDASFLKRLCKFGLRNFVFAIDFYGFIITLIVTLYFTNGILPKSDILPALDIFIQVASSVFAIVLAGLAIVTSFTDESFVCAWVRYGNFEKMITLFQVNLFIPITMLVLSLFARFIYYNDFFAIFLISFFVYMLLSLIDLINFTSTYGLQRGVFVQLNQSKQKTKKKPI